MDPQRTAIPFCENLKITASLGSFYDSECVFLFGHRNIDRVIASDLEKHAGVGSAFISLARGMLKARAKFAQVAKSCHEWRDGSTTAPIDARHS
jgi:hypothetical protein